MSEAWVFRIDKPSMQLRAVMRIAEVELGEAVKQLSDRCFPIDENNTTYWADVDELFDALVNDPDIANEIGKTQARMLLNAMENMSLQKVDVVHFHIL